MILSKDIIDNYKLPSFIRYNKIFNLYDQFDKVFPYIGLSNTRCSIKNLETNLGFVLKQGWRSFKKETQRPPKLPQIINYAVGLPLTYSMLAWELVDSFLFKQENSNLNIVFSSTNKEGAWDIATMAMRGTPSCQSWYSRQSKSLVGSIIDPCCGIIYITNGEATNYGEQMLCRAIVRYVVSDIYGPCLFVEDIYMAKFSQHKAYMLFASFLHKQSKLPIICYDYDAPGDKFIPISSVVNDISAKNLSYRDSQLQYKPLNELYWKKFKTLLSFHNKFDN